MSNPAVFIPAWLDDLGLSANEFRIYAHICRRAGNGCCNAGIASMASACRVKDDTVRAVIKSLESRGLVLIKRVFGGTNEITVVSQPIPIGGTPPKHHPSPQTGGHHSPQTGGHPSRLGGGKGNPIEGNPSKVNNKIAADEFFLESDKPKKPEKLKIKWNSEAGFSNITDKHRAIWKAAYPACNIEIQLAQMHTWLDANPANKKSNYEAFISRWLKRAQDQGGGAQHNQQTNKQNQCNQRPKQQFSGIMENLGIPEL